MVRGAVTGTGANSLTVRDGEGKLFQVAVTSNTRLMRSGQRSGQPIKFAEIHVGDGVGAGGVLDPATHTLHAAFLGVMDAAEVQRAQAELGKSYILGRIAAIDLDRLQLTVHRMDGVNQVIAVDEGTSFRRGGRSPMSSEVASAQGRDGSAQRAGDPGESITLADLKVGESIGARGGLKNGVFTPTELHVYTGERRRHRTDDAGSAEASAGAHP